MKQELDTIIQLNGNKRDVYINAEGSFRKICRMEQGVDFRSRMLAFRGAGGEPPRCPAEIIKKEISLTNTNKEVSRHECISYWPRRQGACNREKAL
ncbi:hypothetical protein [Bacillus sp. OV322]|uniref:hypothetical protein n=1 Tax=Bacillus sp. OV322 TaxID=1882764 RepID=UPI0015A5D4FE|nr:hypothetical protein [Bacillus sp. OV322]